MNQRKRLIFDSLLGTFAALLMCYYADAAQLSGAPRIHDPSRIIKEDNRYYVFGTGSSSGGNSVPIASKYSDNFTNWQDGPAVFSGIPAWAQSEVPNNPHFMWAPDVYFFNNEYRLYYSVSSFGSQNSVIGMATNTTLNFTDPSYAWVDQGMVIESENGAQFNAIDPGIYHDDSTSRMWMTFGSFWQGIHRTELNPATGKQIAAAPAPTRIAQHNPNPPDAIEASHIMKRGQYYYLFVNWDTCCQGVNSTYQIRVGRTTSLTDPTQPFLDRGGFLLRSGGGTSFLKTVGTTIGPGHFSDFSENGVDYFSYHFYDGADNGRSKLAIEEFEWTADGWPVIISAPGDYNLDGAVNAADYTLWRNTRGSTTDLRANGDDTGLSAGVIDAADYAVWQNNYGADYRDAIAAGSGAWNTSVPEPSSLCAAGIALSILFLLDPARRICQDTRRRAA